MLHDKHTFKKWTNSNLKSLHKFFVEFLYDPDIQLFMHIAHNLLEITSISRQAPLVNFEN